MCHFGILDRHARPAKQTRCDRGERNGLIEYARLLPGKSVHQQRYMDERRDLRERIKELNQRRDDIHLEQQAPRRASIVAEASAGNKPDTGSRLLFLLLAISGSFVTALVLAAARRYRLT